MVASNMRYRFYRTGVLRFTRIRSPSPHYVSLSRSQTELDDQATANALYGLQSMSSDSPDVLRLVSALATKLSESSPTLSAQAIGSALYGLQRLDSDKLEVRVEEPHHMLI